MVFYLERDDNLRTCFWKAVDKTIAWVGLHIVADDLAATLCCFTDQPLPDLHFKRDGCLGSSFSWSNRARPKNKGVEIWLQCKNGYVIKIKCFLDQLCHPPGKFVQVEDVCYL